MAGPRERFDVCRTAAAVRVDHTGILVKSHRNGAGHDAGRFARDFSLLLSSAQSWHFSNVIPRASEGGPNYCEKEIHVLRLR